MLKWYITLKKSILSLQFLDLVDRWITTNKNKFTLYRSSITLCQLAKPKPNKSLRCCLPSFFCLSRCLALSFSLLNYLYLVRGREIWLNQLICILTKLTAVKSWGYPAMQIYVKNWSFLNLPVTANLRCHTLVTQTHRKVGWVRRPDWLHLSDGTLPV